MVCNYRGVSISIAIFCGDRGMASVIKSITASDVKDDELQRSWARMTARTTKSGKKKNRRPSAAHDLTDSAKKFQGGCKGLVVPDTNVNDSAGLMKSAVT